MTPKSLRNLLFLVDPITATDLDLEPDLDPDLDPERDLPSGKDCWTSLLLPSALYCCPMTIMFLGSCLGVDCLAPTTVRLLQDDNGSPV